MILKLSSVICIFLCFLTNTVLSGCVEQSDGESVDLPSLNNEKQMIFNQKDGESVDSPQLNNETQLVVDQNNEHPTSSIPEESQESVDDMSLQRIFEMRRSYDIILLISPSDGDYYFGEIIRRNSEWLAFYSGQFITLNIAEIEYEGDTARFIVDKWAQFLLEDGTYRKLESSRYSIVVERSDLINAISKVENGEAESAFVRTEAVPIIPDEDISDEEIIKTPIDITEMNLRELFRMELPYDIELSIFFVDYDSFLGNFTLRDSQWMAASASEVEFLDIVDLKYEQDGAKFLFDRWIERLSENGTIKTTERERHRFFVDRSVVIDAMNEVEKGHSDKAVIRVDAVSNDRLTFDQEDALARGDIEEIERFLDEGTDIEAFDLGGKTALFWAIKYENEPLINMLLDRGADINAGYRSGSQTPFINASMEGHVKIVELLLDRGADINAKTDTGWTALMWAVKKRHNDVVALLMDRGAYLDSRNEDGRTAITVAFESYNFDAMFLLQEAGAGK